MALHVEHNTSSFACSSKVGPILRSFSASRVRRFRRIYQPCRYILRYRVEMSRCNCAYTCRKSSLEGNQSQFLQCIRQAICSLLRSASFLSGRRCTFESLTDVVPVVRSKVQVVFLIRSFFYIDTDSLVGLVP